MSSTGETPHTKPEGVTEQNNTSEQVLTDIEPGACKESMLVTTDSFEEFANEMRSSLEAGNMPNSTNSTISVIQEEITQELGTDEASKNTEPSGEDNAIEDVNLSRVASDISLQPSEDQSASSDQEHNEEDCLNDPVWAGRDKHVFILSSAGKPIYSRYGSEDKLAGLCGIIQALVSVVNDSGKDALRSIHTPTCTVVFLVKGPLILAAASKTRESETQLVLQLTYVFNQIISVLTLSQLTRIFEQRRNYDLRRLLSGVERLIDHLLTFMEKDPAFLLGAVRCLPLAPNMRDNITNAIVSACSKIKDLVFAILMTGSQLITLVRMKKYTLHPADIHLVFNLVRSSESFKTAESWTPICLPKFDPSGFLHGHVSYLSEDCQVCLMLLTVQRDAFFALSQAKQTITEKLRRTNCLEAINEAIAQSQTIPTTKPLRQIATPEMRHFIYKCRSTAQLFSSDRTESASYRSMHRQQKQDDADVKNESVLEGSGESTGSKSGSQDNKWKIPEMDYLENYRKVCGQIHSSARPVNLIYRANMNNTVLAWVTTGFELYVTFDPLVEKALAIASVNKLLSWIKREEDRLFIMKAPTF